MKRRLLALLLAMTLALGLTACGGTEDAAEDENAPAQETAQPEEEIPDAAPEETEDPAEEAVDGSPAEDEAEEPQSGSAAPEEKPQSQPEEGNAASANPGAGSKPAGEQNTAGQKPAGEQKPAQEPQKPAQDETASEPPAEPETPAEPAAEGVDLAAFAASVTADQETWPAMMALEGEALSSFYPGLSDVAAKQCMVYYAMISASGDEIALVEVADSADVETVKGIFQARIDYQVGDGESPGGAWYPAPTEMWRSESRIASNGNFVMLVAHSGADSVVEQFNALFA